MFLKMLPYLNHIHFLPATVPDLKLLHISLDIFCDPHSSHLPRDIHCLHRSWDWQGKQHIIHQCYIMLTHLSRRNTSICGHTHTSAVWLLPSHTLNNKSRAAAVSVTPTVTTSTNLHTIKEVLQEHTHVVWAAHVLGAHDKDSSINSASSDLFHHFLLKQKNRLDVMDRPFVSKVLWFFLTIGWLCFKLFSSIFILRFLELLNCNLQIYKLI